MTQSPDSKNIVHKDAILESLVDGKKTAFQKYTDFFVGQAGIFSLIKFELIHGFIGPLPGAPGYFLRKIFYPKLMNKVGRGVNFGRNLSLRHPGKINIGAGTAIDDNCLLDARGVVSGQFNIGECVLIARDCIIQAKTDLGFIDIGDNCVLAGQCILGSSGGIRLGSSVMISGQCYIGGGRYRTDRSDVPMMKQDVYSEGPVEIGDDCWIGAGVRILDGVKIGKGSVVGAGCVVRENIPEFTVATPHQRLIMLKRETD